MLFLALGLQDLITPDSDPLAFNLQEKRKEGGHPHSASGSQETVLLMPVRVEHVYLRGGYRSAGYRKKIDLDCEIESLKNSFPQGPEANDSKVLTTVSESTIAGLHSVYLALQLTKELHGLLSTPHCWLPSQLSILMQCK